MEIRSSQRALRRTPITFRAALGIVLLIWLPYTLYFALDPGGVLGELLGFIPGVLGVSALLAGGFKLEDCYLRGAPLSRSGLAVLAVVTLLLIPILLSGGWVGWSIMGVLLYAPMSGISQELYFRSSLLPALLRMFGGRTFVALVAHSVLFALWHLQMLVQMPLPLALVSLAVLFLAGMGWGWQTNRDRTVIWAMVQHSLFLMIMALFGLA
jgi:membrane protease YdiL (CAAX protease family)